MTAVVDQPEAAEHQLDEGAAGEKVGYGKPPVRGRFQPGTSGNPKARPRKKRNTASLSQVLADKINVISFDGNLKSVTYQQAIWKRLVVDSAKGNHRATALLLKHKPDLLTKDVCGEAKQTLFDATSRRRIIDRLSVASREEFKAAALAIARENQEREARSS